MNSDFQRKVISQPKGNFPNDNLGEMQVVCRWQQFGMRSAKFVAGRGIYALSRFVQCKSYKENVGSTHSRVCICKCCVAGFLAERRIYALSREGNAVILAPGLRPGVFPGLQFWRLRIWRLAPQNANSNKTFDFRGYANHCPKVLAGATPEALTL